MDTRYFLLLLSVLMIGFTSCRNKDEDVQSAIPRPTPWASLDTVGTTFQFGNKIGTFAYADQQGLALGVTTGYWFFDKSSKQGYRLSGGFYDYSARPVLNNGFYFMTPPAGTFLLLKPIYEDQTYWRDGAGLLGLEDIDPKLSYPANWIPVSQVTRGKSGGDFCAYNDQQQLLVIVKQRGTDNSLYDRLYLLSFQFSKTSVANGTITGIQGISKYKAEKLSIEPNRPGIEIYDVLSTGPSFLISGYAGLGPQAANGNVSYRYVIYKVKPDGSYQTTLDTGSIITDLFSFGGKVYAYNYGTGVFWESANQGDTWQKLPYVLTGSFGAFYEVDGRLIGSKFGLLYEVDFRTGQVQRLYTKELATNLITGVAVYGGNVYVSTLSGFFTKKLADFWQYEKS